MRPLLAAVGMLCIPCAGGQDPCAAAEETQTWNGHCSLLGRWTAELRAMQSAARGCYSVPPDAATAQSLAPLPGILMGGPSAELQCMSACLQLGGPVAHGFFALSPSTRACFCQRTSGDPRQNGLVATAPQLCAPLCTAPASDDVRADCPKLVASGLYSCGPDFCADPSRCLLAGLCDTTCNSCHRNVTAAQLTSAVQLFEMSPVQFGGGLWNNSFLPSIDGSVLNAPEVVVKRRMVDANTACCACGGGDTNRYGSCLDWPVDWKDSRGLTCADYAASFYCSPFGGRADLLATYATEDATSAAATLPHPSGEDVLLWSLQQDSQPLSTVGKMSQFLPSLDSMGDNSAVRPDDSAIAKIALMPLGGAHIEVSGHSAMARCAFWTLRALAETRPCPNCDAWYQDPVAAGSFVHSVNRWYYEIQVGSTANVAQIGFGTHGFKPTQQGGVGDDPYSWAYDGKRKKSWHDPTDDAVDDTDGQADYGSEWAVDDIVGCLLELYPHNTGGTIEFFLNGVSMGHAYTLTAAQVGDGAFFPAATIVDGTWKFGFFEEEIKHMPSPRPNLFRPPTRQVMLMGNLSVTHESGRQALLSGSCSSLDLAALDYGAGIHLSMTMQRQESTSQAHKMCSHMIEPVCDGTPEDSLMWAILGSAGTIGALTMLTIIQGERIRRRRQFQLLGLGSGALRLNQAGIRQVLVDEGARAAFRSKHEALQRMLNGFERRGLIDVNVRRAALLRDVVNIFVHRDEFSDLAVMRSRGLRIRFLEEMGIDEGALRREFYGALFRAVVHADALAMASPAPRELRGGVWVALPSPPSGATVEGTRTSSFEPEPEPSSPVGLTGYLIDEIQPYPSAATDGGNDNVIGGAGGEESLQGRLLTTTEDSGGPSPMQHSYSHTATNMALPMFEPTADGSAFVVAGSMAARLSRSSAERLPPLPPPPTTATVGPGSGMLPVTHWNERQLDWEAPPAPPAPPEEGVSALSMDPNRQAIEMTELAVTVPSQEPRRHTPGQTGGVSEGSFPPVVGVLRRPRHRHIRRLQDFTIRGRRRVERAWRRHRHGDANFAEAQWRGRLDTAEPLALYQLVGVMLAKAIIDDMRIDVSFSKIFYVALLQQPMTLDQRLEILSEVDEALYASLTWLLENNLDEIPDLGDLEVYFDASLPPDSASGAGDDGDSGGTATLPQVVELKPGGSSIAVNEANKVEFVQLRSEFALEGAVETPMQAVREGFFSLLPDFARLSFNAGELALLLHGCPVIDLDDWRRHTEYRGGFHDEHPVVMHFWQILDDFTEQQRAATLHFATGSSKVPLEGFAGLRGSGNVCRFTLCKTDAPTDSLPKAHCCFNRMDLPEYEDLESFSHKLEQAISMAPGGFEIH